MRPGSNSDLGFSVNRLTQNLTLTQSPCLSSSVWDVRHVLVFICKGSPPGGWAAAQ